MADYVVDSGGCWVWQGELTGRGYAALRVDGGMVAAHRVFYERACGPIPDGLVVDHKCRNILCVNPSHLEPVTMKENTLRGFGPTAQNARKTHCIKGHPYKNGNLSIRRGRRHCKLCQVEFTRRWRERTAALTAGEKPIADGGKR